MEIRQVRQQFILTPHIGEVSGKCCLTRLIIYYSVAREVI
jgi:hypothetical protein